MSQTTTITLFRCDTHITDAYITDPDFSILNFVLCATKINTERTQFLAPYTHSPQHINSFRFWQIDLFYCVFQFEIHNLFISIIFNIIQSMIEDTMHLCVCTFVILLNCVKNAGYIWSRIVEIIIHWHIITFRNEVIVIFTILSRCKLPISSLN